MPYGSGCGLPHIYIYIFIYLFMQLGCFFFFFFFLGEKPYMSANLANDSNTQQTDKGNL